MFAASRRKDTMAGLQRANIELLEMDVTVPESVKVSSSLETVALENSAKLAVTWIPRGSGTQSSFGIPDKSVGPSSYVLRPWIASSSLQVAVAHVIVVVGKIDILINNAGVALTGPVAETPVDAYRKVWDTNVGGVITVMQAVFPHMAKHRRGTIINVSSVSSFIPM